MKDKCIVRTSAFHAHLFIERWAYHANKQPLVNTKYYSAIVVYWSTIRFYLFIILEHFSRFHIKALFIQFWL